MRAAPDPRTLTGWSGASPHVLRFPLRAFLRFPVCPPGSSPSSAVLWFPFVRRSPVRSLRPLPGSGSPSVSLRVPFPLSNLHLSAAARRFRRRWSRAAGTNATSSARPPRLDRAIRLHDGWAAAGHDGMPQQSRLLRVRPRAQDIAAPELPRSAVTYAHVRAVAGAECDLRPAWLAGQALSAGRRAPPVVFCHLPEQGETGLPAAAVSQPGSARGSGSGT